MKTILFRKFFHLNFDICADVCLIVCVFVCVCVSYYNCSTKWWYCYIDYILENDHTKYQKSFDYSKNKLKIDRKLNLIKSKLPLNTTVRVKVPKEKLLKRSHQSNLSDTIYLVNGFKRPLKFTEDIGIYLSDLKGKDISGIFYYKQLKLISNQTYQKIHKIITFLKKKKAIRWALE